MYIEKQFWGFPLMISLYDDLKVKDDIYGRLYPRIPRIGFIEGSTVWVTVLYEVRTVSTNLEKKRMSESQGHMSSCMGGIHTYFLRQF